MLERVLMHFYHFTEYSIKKDHQKLYFMPSEQDGIYYSGHLIILILQNPVLNWQ